MDSHGSRFIAIPLSVFRSWNWAQFYLFYFIKKHCCPGGFFRFNNFIGLKKDKMKISKTTMFEVRNFLEKNEVIEVNHPEPFKNSGSKTDGVLKASFSGISKTHKTIQVQESFLEGIKGPSDWKRRRTFILFEYWKVYEKSKNPSFREWMGESYHCSIQKKTIRAKATDFYCIKEMENKAFDSGKVFLNGNPLGYKSFHPGTEPDSKTHFSIKNGTVAGVQSRTLIIENKKLFLKQLRGKVYPSPVQVNEFQLPENEYGKIRNCLFKVFDEENIDKLDKKEHNFLIAITYLSSILNQKASGISIDKLIRIVLGNYHLVEVSRIQTRTNYTNRLLKSIEFNFSAGYFLEFCKAYRGDVKISLGDIINLSQIKETEIPDEKDSKIDNNLYLNYRDRVGDRLISGFSKMGFFESSEYSEQLFKVFKGFDCEEDVLRFLSGSGGNNGISIAKNCYKKESGISGVLDGYLEKDHQITDDFEIVDYGTFQEVENTGGSFWKNSSAPSFKVEPERDNCNKGQLRYLQENKKNNLQLNDEGKFSNSYQKKAIRLEPTLLGTQARTSKESFEIMEKHILWHCSNSLCSLKQYEVPVGMVSASPSSNSPL